MSDLQDPFPLTEDGADEEPGVARRHALWIMVVLACLAVVVGCLMLLLGGGSGGGHHKIDLLPPVHTRPSRPTASAGPPATAATSGAAHTASPSIGASGSTSRSGIPGAATSAPAGPPRSGNPCHGGSSCLVPGDGGALAAVNAFRGEHGLAAVPGGVTSNAQLCAQNRGGGSTCVPHYAWTTLSAQNGAKAVAKISQFAGDWLLDPDIKTVSVGWAYVGGQYECALLKAP